MFKRPVHLSVLSNNYTGYAANHLHWALNYRTSVSSLLSKVTLLGEVGDKSYYSNNNEINAHQIIEDLGENHHNKAENEAGNAHPETKSWKCYRYS
jgi:hypothetical protein